MMANSANNVLFTTGSSMVGTQPLSHVGISSNSQVSLTTSSSATSYLPGSMPLLPAARSAIVQRLSTIVPMYGNQLPPIPRFTGEEDSSESGTFFDWLEQFKDVATRPVR